MRPESSSLVRTTQGVEEDIKRLQRFYAQYAFEVGDLVEFKNLSPGYLVYPELFNRSNTTLSIDVRDFIHVIVLENVSELMVCVLGTTIHTSLRFYTARLSFKPKYPDPGASLEPLEI